LDEIQATRHTRAHDWSKGTALLMPYNPLPVAILPRHVSIVFSSFVSSSSFIPFTQFVSLNYYLQQNSSFKIEYGLKFSC